MNDIAQAINGIAQAWMEYLKGRDASYSRKLDKKEKQKLQYATQIALRCKELNIEDKELNKLIDRFFI